MGFWPKVWKDVTEWMDRDTPENLVDEDAEGYSTNPFSNYVGGHMLHLTDNITQKQLIVLI